MAQDLTLEEAREAFTKLAAEIGSKAEIWPSLATVGRGHEGAALVDASIYPKGILERTMLRVKGSSWRELIDNARAAWAEHSDLHAVNTIREMALAIITITADRGECTDAALRATFDAADIIRFGERACEQATAMASNGPFRIVTLAGANDAEAA